MAGTIEDRVTELCKPLIESLGLQLWGVRYRQGGSKGILEIYVETPDGVSADQCGEALTVLSPALDAADIIGPAYVLEVSSPGLDRILFTVDEARMYIGSVIKAELRMPVQSRHKVRGKLLEISSDGLLKIEDEISGILDIAFANIATARLVPMFKDNNKKNPKSAS